MALLARFVGIGRATILTSNTDKVRLKIGTNTGVSTGVVYSAAATPDGDGWSRIAFPTLSSGTTYYYRVEMTTGTTVTLDTEATVGRFQTPPADAASFTFNFASCTDAANPVVFANIANRNDDLFLHLGDLYYADALDTSLANYKAQIKGRLQSSNHELLFSQTNTVYEPSDHDFGMGNNVVGSTNTAARDNFNIAYRQAIAAAPVPATTGTYYTFMWGRIRFIALDCRSFKSGNGVTDTSSKTMLGTAQKTWFKNLVDTSTAAVNIMIGDTPWVGPKVGTDDHWAAYDTERTELGNYIKSSGKNFAYLCGDQHCLAVDDGSNVKGGFPLFSAAPLYNNASIKPDPTSTNPLSSLYSEGIYPPLPHSSAFISQYGHIAVTDTGGTSVKLAYTGYSADGTSRLTYTHTYAVGGGPVTYDVNLTPVSATKDDTANTATLTWNLAGTDASKVTGFYAGRNATASLPAFESSLRTAATRSQTFTGLTDGEKYDLYVDAVIGTERVRREVSSITLASDTTLDIQVTATASVDDTANSAVLTWTLSGADASQVTAWTAARTQGGNANPFKSPSLPAAQRTYTFTQLVDGSTYTLTATAIVGTTEEANASVTVTLAQGAGGTWVTIYDGPGTAFTDTGLTVDTAYQYRYAAANSDGVSGWSPVTSTRTGTVVSNPPDDPTLPPVITGTTASSVAVSLPAVTGATGYVLQRALAASSTWTTVYDGTARTFTDSGLSPSTGYKYRYAARNSAGQSVGWSPTVNATTNAQGPSSGTTQPISAKVARNMVGAVEHQNFGGSNSVYMKFAAVEDWTDRLGYTRIRSQIITSAASAKDYVAFCRRKGWKWTMPTYTANNSTTDDEAKAKVKWVAENAADVAGGFEGMNEPSHYSGLSTSGWQDKVLHTQEVLFNTVNSYPQLNGVPVLSSAMHQKEAEDALNAGTNWWQQLANRGVTQFFDVSALHTYGGAGGGPELKLDSRVKIIKDAYGPKPVWVTETGYSDEWGNTTTQATGVGYGMRLPLAFVERGIPVHVYELLDDAPSYQTGVQRVFGVVSTGTTDAAALDPTNWKLKFVGTGIKTVLDAWRDPAGTPDYTPTKVKCDVSTSATNVHVLVTATKAQSDNGVATAWVYREANAGASATSVTITDRVGARQFSVDWQVTRVDLR